MYTIACIAPDGTERAIERNIFSENKTFDTVREAWERNDDMGSRWCFYPIRVVINASDNMISSVADGIPEIYVGLKLDKLMEDIKSGELVIEY